MKLRRAIRLYAGLPHPEALSTNDVRAATARIQRMLEYREWDHRALGEIVRRELMRAGRETAR